jgi:hypothetical protein
MNKPWTEEQTKESVKRQKKAVYIILPIIAALYFSFRAILGVWYEDEIQQLIKLGYLSTDYTKEDISDFCLTYYNDLEEVYLVACFWFL